MGGLTVKKKIAALLFALVFIYGLAGCVQAGEVEIKQISVDRLVLAESVTELQTVSDAIVVFTPTGRENVLSYYSDGNVSSGYTKTNGTVSEVLKGEVSVGDTLWITEECYTTDNGTVLWTQQGYLPMQDGESYLLFLMRYPEESNIVYGGMYYPTDLEYGKYVLPGNEAAAALISEKTEKNFEVGSGGDLENYIEWYDEVALLYPALFE